MQENQMQEHTPQLMSRSNTDNTFIAEQSTPEVNAHENDSNDSFHTQSLECLFGQIDDIVQDSEFILKSLRPYVIRAMNHRQDTVVLHEIVNFIDNRVACSNTGYCCSWRHLYTISRVLNGNILMIEGTEIVENENVKCEYAPSSDEIESQDTEEDLQESECESIDEDKDVSSDASGDGDELNECMERECTVMQAPPVQVETPVDKKDEIADDILAEFENQKDDTDTISDDTSVLSEGFLEELKNMSSCPDDIVDPNHVAFFTELEIFNPSKA